MRLCDVIDSVAWAIDQTWLERIRTIALGEAEGPEAVAAKLGRPLQNTQETTVRDGVAIVPIVGPIFRYANLFTEVSGATSIELFARDFTTALEDPAVRAILLDINSPGGQADGINEAANMIRAGAARKPVLAYVGGMGASAAYWLASAAEAIGVDAIAALGSIGVVAVVRRAAQDPGSAEFVSSQSPNKRPDLSTPGGKAQVQARVDAIAAVFVSAVAEFRGVTEAQVLSDFGGGGVRIGRAAVDARMADRTTSLETMVAELAAGRRMKRAHIMTDAEATALADKAREEGHATGHKAGLDEAKKDVEGQLAEARKAGAAAERGRIVGIDENTLPGFDALAAEAKAQGWAVADFLAKQTKAQKDAGAKRIETAKAEDVKIPVVSASPTGEAQAKGAADPAKSVEDRAREKWAASEDLRNDFASFEDFLALEKRGLTERKRQRAA